MKIFSLIFFFLFFLLFPKYSNLQEISIIYTVDNVPITNNQIKNEISYLKIVNENLNKMEDKSLVIYASKSILREKIKELEISKYFKFGLNDKIVEQNLSNFISKRGLNSLDDFKKILKNSDLSVDYVKKKIEIELLWNNLIYEKYKNKLSIDVDKIKEDLKFQTENQNKVEEYKLAEILFTPQSKSTENEEIEEIKESIKKIGFESSAIAYSISNTASEGGNIGWVKETQLSKNVIREVENLSIGQTTEVLNSPAGKLILILLDKREVKEEISLEEELKKAILIERNKQLNQFSSIYFKKVEINTTINEK
tara:strand:- start:1286 stop:2218 length:933 start_codon:yes stop_codon:yes gene_type:complete